MCIVFIRVDDKWKDYLLNPNYNGIKSFIVIDCSVEDREKSSHIEQQPPIGDRK